MINETEAKIEKVFPLTNSILQFFLTPTNFINYKAGQYLQIILKDEKLSFSIANAPLGAKKYELHIKHQAENLLHQTLLDEIKSKGKLSLSLPFGKCHFNALKPTLPVLFIAAGTGFAPIKAIIEQLLADNDTRNFELYWSAREKSDLYLEDLVLQWQKHVENFKYFSVLSQEGRTSLQTKILKKHKDNLKNLSIVISGPFDFSLSTRDWLLDAGARKENLFSDAF